MKKYNTPEFKLSMFNLENVKTTDPISGTDPTGYNNAIANGAQNVEIDLANFTISF